MSNYTIDELRQLAIDHADALCDELAGGWRWMNHPPAPAALHRGDCVLHFLCSEQDGTALLTIEAHLPDTWGEVEGFTAPEITVRAERSAESIATDIARQLLPAHAEQTARVREALERVERPEAVTASIVDYFLDTMPGGVPDAHHPSTAASSRGARAFSASLRLSHDAQTTDLHLRGLPLDLARSIVHRTGRRLGNGEPAEGSPERVLNTLADAITELAGTRTTIPTATLLRETALNILVLSRIASNRLEDRAARDQIEDLADQLITAIRHRTRALPGEPTADAHPTVQEQTPSEATDE
ncbi:hypothetical protein [Glycomyces sp. NRRL B-16210]|uniref:hypothetical protein n=1 Tax=Glycomyces sp. NRRL B-16210 TaxID=1463821 RepID=UPI0004BF5C61|nr:hypothetical protein [Glycomyces sp. NRRL B-16210]